MSLPTLAQSALAQTALALVAPGRGILAADESPATMSSRLRATGVEPSAEARRSYRQMLLTAPGLNAFVSGVILAPETFEQRLDDGRGFAAALRDQGMLTGLKVDTGAKPLAGAPGETVTEGLDGLRERLADAVAGGAVFAKWRAVLRIGPGTPSRRALVANAHALARYAALCQEAGVVPVVEPEVLLDGDHDLAAAEAATTAALREVFLALGEQGVRPEAIVLKPSMVLPGAAGDRGASVDEVAQASVRTLRCCVPREVPGVAFLSGGQSPQLATDHLRAICALGPHPWRVTFSFGRALVSPALTAWRGEERRVPDGQRALLERCAAAAAAVSA